ncbi:MAG: hypothetical protein J7L72_07185 [Candidatus Aminicenantes bacterium]|nr:hypothetical protein [Candidatus Aminicenantes bacterium]
MKDWFVLNTKPKKEFQVERLFQEGGFEVYNPKYKQEKKILPFFSGYEFLYFDYPDQYKKVKYTRGVKRIVGNKEGPIPVSETIIEEIRKREINGFIELDKYGSEPEVGDEVQIMEGPMKGLKGIFKKGLNPKERALVLMNYVSYQGHVIIEKKKLKKVL